VTELTTPTTPTALTLEDALHIAHRLAVTNGSRPTPAALAADARAIQGRIPSTTRAWAYQWIAQATRSAGTVTIDALADAWRIEAARRISAAPSVPWTGQVDEQWPAWERARRRALVAGATPEGAIQYANTGVGISPQPERAIDPAAVQAAKARALGKVQEMRQHADQRAAKHFDGSVNRHTGITGGAQ